MQSTRNPLPVVAVFVLAAASLVVASGVIPPLALAKPQYPLFGYNDAFENGSRDEAMEPMLRAASAGGAEVIRFPLSWCRVAENTAVGQEEVPLAVEEWDWSGTKRSHYAPANYDKLFELVRRRNQNATARDDVRVIAELLDSPAWANSPVDPGTEAGGCANRPVRDPATGMTLYDETGQPVPESAVAVPPSPDRLDAWRKFTAEVLRRWGAPKYGIAAIEVWNEENLPRYWGSIRPAASFHGDPKRYVELFEATADEADGRVPVLIGGLAMSAPNAGWYVRRLASRMKSSRVDGMSLHIYASNRKARKSKRRLVAQLRVAKRAARRWPRRKRPDRWITETGFPLRADVTDPVTRADLRRQCRRLVWTYRRFATHARSLIVHSLGDLSHELRLFGVGTFTGSDPAFTPRPAYRGLRRVARDRRPRC